jgi:hypothetical protein
MISDSLVSATAGYGMTGVQFLTANKCDYCCNTSVHLVARYRRSTTHYARSSCFTATQGEVAPPPSPPPPPKLCSMAPQCMTDDGTARRTLSFGTG